ncbi:MAG: copper resistance protein CopC [Chloroflexi bacterium]|nr:copper resistance protein CopC [Chloroflexota bacterium]
MRMWKDRLLLFAATVAIVALAVAACGGGSSQQASDTANGLPGQLFAAHFVDSTPAHGQQFAQVPNQILINFNFTLADNSSISLTRDGVAVPVGAAKVGGERRLQLASDVTGVQGNGLYVVDYKACWPDRSCHNGRLAFRVDASKSSSYLDMRGRADVAVSMKDVAFSPARILVSKGAIVTWTNNDGVQHFVNTDPHPVHNYLPGLNSLEIKPGQSYTYTFSDAGEWPYHCSLHFPQNMVASIIVS